MMVNWLPAALRTCLILLAMVGLSGEALARPQTKVFLNGVPAPVFFNDGDSFTVLGGQHEGIRTRLAGYNTLESFGAVHRWGDWNAHELYVVAKMATMNARRGVWHCHSDMNRDGYGRTLWTCPDLVLDQLRKGLAHVMLVSDDDAPAEHLAAMRSAQAEKRGIWAKGIPEFVLTSLHSKDEGYEGTNYNRLVSTANGKSTKWIHNDIYKECQEVCHTTGTCMVYVAMNRRFGATRAECLMH